MESRPKMPRELNSLNEISISLQEGSQYSLGSALARLREKNLFRDPRVDGFDTRDTMRFQFLARLGFSREKRIRNICPA